MSPDFAEALYQNAQYNALLKNVHKSIDNLEKAIKSDSNYCLKASNDRSFDTIRNDVGKLQERLRDEKRDCAEGIYHQIKNNHNAFLSLIEQIYNDVSIDVKDFEFKNCEDKIQTQIERIETLIRRNSYIDLLEVNGTFLENLKKNEDKQLSSAKSILLSHNNSFDISISDLKNVEKYRKDKFSNKLAWVFWSGFLYFIPALSLLFMFCYIFYYHPNYDSQYAFQYATIFVPVWNLLIIFLMVVSGKNTFEGMTHTHLIIVLATFAFFGIILFAIYCQRKRCIESMADKEIKYTIERNHKIESYLKSLN